jgi:hypothetical protein
MAIFRVVSLVFAALIVAASSLLAQVSRTWLPNIGDQFLCAVSYSCPCGIDQSFSENDTILFVIAGKSDSSISIDNKVIAGHYYHFVPVPNPHDTSSLIYFPSSSNLIFESNNIKSSISTGYVRPPSDSLYTFLLKNDSIAFRNGDTIHTVWFATEPINYQGSGPWHSAVMNFSPELGWFVSMQGCNAQLDLQTALDYENWYVNLISATKVERGVESYPSASAVSFLKYQSNLLEFNYYGTANGHSICRLLDPLGRPIQSWQMPIESGERQIALNVADVPSGVYFLRVSGDGIDEVKKVAIVH